MDGSKKTNLFVSDAGLDFSVTSVGLSKVSLRSNLKSSFYINTSLIMWLGLVLVTRLER